MTIYSKTVKRPAQTLVFLLSFLLVFLPGVMLSPLALADGLFWSTEGPSTPESGTGTEFGRSLLSFTTPLSQRSVGSEAVKSSFHFDLTEFRWKGTTAAQSEYYWVSVPLEYRQKRGRSAEFIVRAEPGLMTDFEALESDNIAMNVDLIGRLHRRDGSFWQFGVTVDRVFGDFNPRPVVGAAFKPTRSTEVLLGFPRTRIQTSWNESLATYFRVAPEGGVWEEEITGQTGTFRTAYTNWKMGLGVDFHWQGAFWLNAEVGQMRNRRIWSTDDTGASVVATPAQDSYWQTGISLRY
ncbi:MAG: hypothetical protein CMI13_05115 [Oleibacter sp.]|nr:hypothetical protein [Thalassolituus sp.]|tara:strand:+ start:1124 stop:2008 length:885 start_codon:yes stop_codon:yes gene_type:complete